MAARIMHPLDNVIWQALTTRQSHLSEGAGLARRFNPEISPFGAFLTPDQDGYDALRELVHDDGVVRVFLPEPYSARRGWDYVYGAPLWEMVYEDGGHSGQHVSQTRDFVLLGTPDISEMLDLVKLTEPGPFTERTHEMGTYLGIRDRGKLVAMAGERLRVPGYTEVSAVCTHPDHTGKGYARALMAEIMNLIRGRGETPMLHVRQDNMRAIEIYQHLGFRERALLYNAVLRKE
jgi:ribosomal protein S18 acetylase RimI-like enzyme